MQIATGKMNGLFILLMIAFSPKFQHIKYTTLWTLQVIERTYEKFTRTLEEMKIHLQIVLGMKCYGER
jgi:hypothetical protein